MELVSETKTYSLKEARLDDEMVLTGVIYRLKEMKSFFFVHLQVGREFIQVVVSKNLIQKLYEQSTVEVHGHFQAASVKDLLIHYRDREFVATKVMEINVPESTMPFDITKTELAVNNATLFDYRALTLKHPKLMAVFRIQEGIVKSFREYFSSLGFVEIRTPKIVKAGAEGGANIFSLNYFGETAYLAQSPQFYKEYMAGVYQKVFEIGPVFRAEKHHTSRHVNEYTSMDIEFGPLSSFQQIMEHEVGFLRHLIESLKVHYAYELSLLEVELPEIQSVPRITFQEAKLLLKEEVPIEYQEENDLSPEEEMKLCELIKKETGSEFIFVTHYPSSKRPFYAKETKGNEEVTESFDLLFRGVEITTGGERINRLSELHKKMEKKNLLPADFDFFTLIHRYGVLPHGGFGLGLERLTQKLVGLSNIKEATLFPRDVTRLLP